VGKAKSGMNSINIYFDKYIRYIFFLLLITTFSLTVLLPVYSDELYWKMQLGRIFFDNMETIGVSGSPSCGAYAFPVPVLLLPFRILDWLLYGFLDNPLWLRLASVPSAIVSLALIGVEIGRLFRPEIAFWKSITATFAFATLGVLPFGLVVSRPEQLLLLTIALMTIRACRLEPAGLKTPPGPMGKWRDWGIGLAVGLAGALALSSHPKAMYFLPIFLIAAAATTERIWPRVIALAIPTVTVLAAYPYWSARLACPDDAGFRAGFAERSLIPAIQAGLGHAFLTAQLALSPIKFTFVWLILFGKKHMAEWLPSRPPSLFVNGVDHAIEALILLLMAAGIAAYGVVVWRVVRSRSGWRPAFAVGALWACLWLLSFSTGETSDYEGTLMVPLFALASILSIWLARDAIAGFFGAHFAALSARTFLYGLVAISIVSQITLLSIFTPDIDAWRKGGYPAGQEHSASAFNYSEFAPEIVRAAARCGISPGTPARHLIVDELTYYPFRQSYQPILMAYMALVEERQGAAALRQLIGKIGADGMIARCSAVPNALAAETIADGPFCCHPAFHMLGEMSVP
jgi:hypothetical protein